MTEEHRLVRSGYDRIAERYAATTCEGRTEATYYRSFLDRCMARLPDGARVLDLGCGAGIVASDMATRSRLVGVDLSIEQLRLARRRVSSALFVQADMTGLEIRDRSLDAVAAFWSIIHVRRELHPELFGRIRRWLRPGGMLFGTFGSGDNPHEEHDFYGAPMYWSHFDAPTNRRLLADAGFRIEQADTIEDMDESHLWVIATA
jgi:cyclopropane fatty-acyl-phospholipid synthase-like methyltransferase